MAGYKTTMTKRKFTNKRPRSAASRAFSRSLTKTIPLGKNDYGFPDKFKTKLRYCESGYWSAAAGGSQSNTFRMNSVYDPNLSGIGHQPMYHDTLALIYGKYRVTKAVITVKFASSSPPALTAVNYGPTCVGLVCSNSSSFVSTSVDQRMEQNDNSTKILQPKGGGNEVVTCRQTFYPGRDLGNGAIDDSGAGSFGNNPAQVYHCHAFKIDQGESSAIQWYATIEYEIECFQRLEQPSS